MLLLYMVVYAAIILMVVYAAIILIILGYSVIWHQIMLQKEC